MNIWLIEWSDHLKENLFKVVVQCKNKKEAIEISKKEFLSKTNGIAGCVEENYDFIKVDKITNNIVLLSSFD